ncbi:MAG: hypothetical protein IKX71_02270, partial [Bacteroidales bacterium]|nr:hypothetical protein [Bacteroidales bacterium]
MKKFQFAFLAAALLMVLSLSSCSKDYGQICFPVNTPDAYEMTAGQTLDIDMSVENLMDGQIAVSANADNPDYSVTVSEPEADKFKVSVTAPDFIKEQTVVNLLVEATDVAHEFREKISRPITITVKPAANLSRVAQKANCLISAPGKILCFKAFVGNSASVTDFDAANLIWQDKQGLVTKVAKSDDEIVVWLADGVCGNALVGAYKNNTLAWTYHVWVINDNPAVAYEYTNGDGVKFSFIDRNLGAIDASAEGDANGLYYYWGNRHPYAGGTTTVYDIAGNALEYTTEETATICSENSLDDIYEYS